MTQHDRLCRHLHRALVLLFAALPAVAAIVPSGSALGSGWVKGPHQHYVKVSGARTQETRFAGVEGTADDFEESATDTSLYGEFGLPFSHPLQVEFSGIRRSVSREDPVVGDKFEGAAYGDSELRLKGQAFKWSQGAGGVLGAVSAGGRLPTTEAHYRSHQVADSHGDHIPETQRKLVAPIDRGLPGLSGGLGLSGWYDFVWANAAWGLTEGTSESWREEKLSGTFGFSLPYNSWIQFDLGRNRTRDATAPEGLTTTSQSLERGLGIGLTLYQGMAVEASYSERREVEGGWQGPIRTARIGVSHRTL